MVADVSAKVRTRHLVSCFPTETKLLHAKLITSSGGGGGSPEGEMGILAKFA